MDEILRRAARAIAAAAGVEHCGFYVLSDDGRLLPRLGVDRRALPPATVEAFLSRPLDPAADRFLRQVLDEKRPVVCADAQTDPRLDPALARVLGVRSILALPLSVGERVLAVALAASFEGRRDFAPEQIELAADIAGAAAPALDYARLAAEGGHRLAENESIQRVTSTLLQGLDLEAVLRVVCSEAQRLTGALGSSVCTLAGDGWLRLVYNSGQAAPQDRFPVQGSLAGAALRAGQIMVSNQPAGDERLFDRPGLRRPANLAVAPLRAGERTIGVLYCADKPAGFTAADQRLISLFADQAAMAIVHAQLRQQARSLAALEERERLAREIHDNLAQALGLLKLQASRAADLLADGQAEPARTLLGELARTAGAAQADAREAIFNLRHSPGSGGEFVSALRAHLEHCRTAYGLEARLELAGHGLAALPPEVVSQVTRIIQEALANVRKHAHASQARVRLEQADGELRVTVEDDGQGFDPAAVLGPDCAGAGLQIMRERAEGVGGALEIVSRPAGGTRIVARVPLAGRG